MSMEISLPSATSAVNSISSIKEGIRIPVLALLGSGKSNAVSVVNLSEDEMD